MHKHLIYIICWHPKYPSRNHKYWGYHDKDLCQANIRSTIIQTHQILVASPYKQCISNRSGCKIHNYQKRSHINIIRHKHAKQRYTSTLAISCWLVNVFYCEQDRLIRTKTSFRQHKAYCSFLFPFNIHLLEWILCGIYVLSLKKQIRKFRRMDLPY